MPLFYNPGNITAEEYKKEKELFVSNYSGSSYLLLLSMFTINIYLNYFHHLLHHFYPILHENFVVYVISDLLISIPSILIPMFFPSVVYPLVIVLTLVYIVACYLYPQDPKKNTFKAVSVGFVEFRSMINLWTLIAILAVDFKVFPRMHTKSEFYGVSLMDIGVGAIVVCSGVAAGLKENTTPYFKNLVSNILHSIPFFVIGGVRLLATGAVNYQHHMSEYGLHMNFFFVLGFVQILTAVINSPRKYCWIASLLLISSYEMVLNVFDLYTYTLTADRATSFFAANREGVLSVFGYTAIQIGSTAIGYYYSLYTTKSDRIQLNIKVLFISSLMFVVYEVLSIYLLPCRPLINITYFLAVMSMMMVCYSICDIIPMFLPITQTAGSNGLSLNQLPLFLIANLLTGLINLTVYTLYVPFFDTLVILFSYIACVRLQAFFLGYYRWTFKIQSLQLVQLDTDYRTPLRVYSPLSLFKQSHSKKTD
ncbi:GPI-anchored wall transfer protein, putative [Entamoeba invadens IP1]|uniref:GPI-anchored wall transfer protein, putative n=1 Tax=Entamoeba invadens IP1 TaxID=370355 RepID=A0A0A1U623_ENTIV|nr:GPI-anchored wall transfer protein, putative [Entamoeba invadens IP1]ELP88330.1 GPI-anchored wall transfer protein, putative [Entamoeba invadens IP1]|eukprot:XP_004255101.1 GPI-anchored wall transfer protein, putative [Entamoeba invadens IP1]